jgi:hypothetical protein
MIRCQEPFRIQLFQMFYTHMNISPIGRWTLDMVHLIHGHMIAVFQLCQYYIHIFHYPILLWQPILRLYHLCIRKGYWNTPAFHWHCLKVKSPWAPDIAEKWHFILPLNPLNFLIELVRSCLLCPPSNVCLGGPRIIIPLYSCLFWYGLDWSDSGSGLLEASWQ